MSPLIIIGMHRSGTSMLTRLIENIGYEIGKHRDQNDESMHFWRLNEWVFRQVNATWDNPYNFQYLDELTKMRLLVVLRMHLKGVLAAKYSGLVKSFFLDLTEYTGKWSWKDPKNTFTLELWQEIFPKAKIIHIYRNPIDVARSLQARAESKIEGYRPTKRSKIKELLARGKLQYCDSVRVLDLIEGIRLWESYVEKSFSYDFDVLHIKYEDLLENPQHHLREICDYLGEKPSIGLLDEIAEKLDVKRAYSYRRIDIPKEVLDYVEGSEVCRTLGYSKL